MEEKSKKVKFTEEEISYNGGATMRTILLNAIKMQALYSGGKIKYIETSTLTN